MVETLKHYLQCENAHLHFKHVAVSKHPFIFVFRGHEPKVENYCTEGMRTLRAMRAALTYSC